LINSESVQSFQSAESAMSDIPSADWSWIDAVCSRFEKAWKHGPRPRIEEFLARVPEPQWPPLLAELLRVERELRQRAGEEPAAEEYSRRFPEHDDIVALVFRPGDTSPPTSGLVAPPAPTLARSTSTSLSTSARPEELANHPDYEIVRKLGHGGMGVVWLARNRLMGRDEVLKVMGGHIVKQAGVLDRFVREIRAVARLRHPNIVSAYTAFRFGTSFVFAMEYVDGLDLRRMVKARGPMPIGHACYFAHQAALGLEHAHDEGMVHRDIKPGNLMLSHKKNRAVIKVLDFGLAKATSEQNADELGIGMPILPIDFGAHLTCTGEMLGTPDFIAPEQIVDAQQADIRADIYSLGCTLYFLLSGHAPFPGLDLKDLLKAHRKLDAPPLHELRAEVPAELSALVARMMAKDPGRRLQVPAEAAAALVPFFRKQPAAGTSITLGAAQDVPRDAGSGLLATTLAETKARFAGAEESARAPGPPGSSVITFAEIVDEPMVRSGRSIGRRNRPYWSGATSAVALTLAAVASGVVFFQQNREQVGVDETRRGLTAARPPRSVPIEHGSEGKDTSPGGPLERDAIVVQKPRASSGPKATLHEPPRSSAAESRPAGSLTPRPERIASAEPGNGHAKGEPGLRGGGPGGRSDKQASPGVADEPLEIIAVESDVPAESTGLVPNKPMRWSGIFYIIVAEDDARQAGELVAARFMEYERAWLGLLSAKGDKEGKEAALRALRQHGTALNEEDAILSAEELDLRRQWNEVRVQYDAFEYLKKSGERGQLAVVLDALALQQRQTRFRIDQIREELRLLNGQIDELRQAEVRPGEVDKLKASMDLKRVAYVQALRALRTWVDATREQYSLRAKEGEVKAAIEAKNRGLRRRTFKLGPSQKFKEIEAKLRRHEEWVNPGAAPPRRRGKAKTTPSTAASLPPTF
jgi:serine/threonine protein kinase